MRPRLLFLTLCGALLLAGWLARPGQTLPSYARREGFSCQACHFRMPELNADGYDYLRRGLRMELPPASETPKPGTPVAAVPHMLGEALPLNWADYLSVIGDSSVNFAHHARTTFDAGGVDLWASGPIDRHVSVAADLSFDAENGGVSVANAYAQYVTDARPCFGSVRIGQVQPFAILTNQGGPSMALSQPLVLSLPSEAGSTWTPTTPVRSLEVGAVQSARWNAYLALAQPQATPVTDTTGIPLSRHNDVYASAEYDFGTSGDSLTGYGYWGTNALDGDIDSHFYRVGAFANVFLPSAKGVAGYVQGADRAADGSLLATNGLFAQAEYLPTERWGVYARYDYLLRDLVGGGSEHPQGPTLGVTWWAQTQLNLTAEAQFQNGSPDVGNALKLDAAWAF